MNILPYNNGVQTPQLPVSADLGGGLCQDVFFHQVLPRVDQESVYKIYISSRGWKQIAASKNFPFKYMEFFKNLKSDAPDGVCDGRIAENNLDANSKQIVFFDHEKNKLIHWDIQKNKKTNQGVIACDQVFTNGKMIYLVDDSGWKRISLFILESQSDELKINKRLILDDFSYARNRENEGAFLASKEDGDVIIFHNDGETIATLPCPENCHLGHHAFEVFENKFFVVYVKLVQEGRPEQHLLGFDLKTGTQIVQQVVERHVTNMKAFPGYLVLSVKNVLSNSRDDRKYILLDSSTLKVRHTIIPEVKKDSLDTAVEFAVHCGKLIEYQWDGDIYIYNIETGELAYEVIPSRQNTLAIKGNYMAFARIDHVQIWSLKTLRCLFKLDIKNVEKIHFEINEEPYLVIATKEGVQVWNPKLKKEAT